MCSEDGTPCEPCAANGKFKAPLMQGRGLHVGTQLEPLTEQAKGQDLLVWGPASVEAVSEDAKLVRMTAIEAALPAAFRRGLISILHKDQVAGHYRPLQPIDPTRAPAGRARQLAEYLMQTHGGAPTAVLEVTKEIAQAFPHLNPYLGTKQFFAGGVIYGDTETGRFIQDEIRQGNLNSYSIAGMPTDVAKLSICNADACKEVDDVRAIDMSAITLGSIQGGEGPLSAKVRNPGAAFLLLQQGAPDAVAAPEPEGARCSSPPASVWGPETSMKTPALVTILAQAQTHLQKLPEADQKAVKAIFEQVDNSTASPEFAAMLAEFSRRLEAMEQRLAQAPAAPAAPATPPPGSSPDAVEQAATKAAEKALAGMKALLAQAKPAETPAPAGKPAGEAEGAAQKLLEAAQSGDPAALMEAWRTSRGVPA